MPTSFNATRIYARIRTTPDTLFELIPHSRRRKLQESYHAILGVLIIYKNHDEAALINASSNRSIDEFFFA